jgi:hypothetical protein
MKCILGGFFTEQKTGVPLILRYSMVCLNILQNTFGGILNYIPQQFQRIYWEFEKRKSRIQNDKPDNLLDVLLLYLSNINGGMDGHGDALLSPDTLSKKCTANLPAKFDNENLSIGS